MDRRFDRRRSRLSGNESAIRSFESNAAADRRRHHRDASSPAIIRRDRDAAVDAAPGLQRGEQELAQLRLQLAQALRVAARGAGRDQRQGGADQASLEARQRRRAVGVGEHAAQHRAEALDQVAAGAGERRDLRRRLGAEQAGDVGLGGEEAERRRRCRPAPARAGPPRRPGRAPRPAPRRRPRSRWQRRPASVS